MNSADFRKLIFVFQAILAYVKFLFTVAWRSLAAAIGIAVLLGVVLGTLSGLEMIDNSMTERLAALVALPVTLLSVSCVIAFEVRKKFKVDVFFQT